MRKIFSGLFLCAARLNKKLANIAYNSYYFFNCQAAFWGQKAGEDRGIQNIVEFPSLRVIVNNHLSSGITREKPSRKPPAGWRIINLAEYRKSS